MPDIDDDILVDRRSWRRLSQDHARIEAACLSLLSLAREGPRRSRDASAGLFSLSVTVADHLGVEDEVIDLVAQAVAAGYSHAEALAMREELAALRRDWTGFLCRWVEVEVAAAWEAFVVDLQAILGRLARQVRREDQILYGRAYDLGVIGHGASSMQ